MVKKNLAIAVALTVLGLIATVFQQATSTDRLARKPYTGIADFQINETDLPQDGSSGYKIKNGRIFYDSGWDPQLVQAADRATFVALDINWARDKNQIWYDGEPIRPQASRDGAIDIDTFEPFPEPYSNLAKDKRAVYQIEMGHSDGESDWVYHELLGADPATFTFLINVDCAKDKNTFYAFLTDSDGFFKIAPVDSWECVSSNDKQQTYGADRGVIASSSQGFNSYTSTKYGFTFTYPADWRVGDNEIGYGTLQLLNYDPATAEGKGGFPLGDNKIEAGILGNDAAGYVGLPNWRHVGEHTVLAGIDMWRFDPDISDYGILTYIVTLPSNNYLGISMYGDSSNFHVLDDAIATLRWTQ